MYHYVYTLLNKEGTRKQTVVGMNLLESLQVLFEWYGRDILTSTDISEIKVFGGKRNTDQPFAVSSELINKVLDSFRKQNSGKLSKYLTEEFKKGCPEDSRDADPITAEEWEDIPYGEYVKKDKYLSQCYRLSTLLETFEAGLKQTKQDNPFPQWPFDPFTRTRVPPEKLSELLEQASNVAVDIPPLFTVFMQGISQGIFNVEQGMANPYIGMTDHINPEFQKFVEKAVEYLGLSKESAKSDDADVELAMKLAEQFAAEGYTQQ